MQRCADSEVSCNLLSPPTLGPRGPRHLAKHALPLAPGPAPGPAPAQAPGAQCWARLAHGNFSIEQRPRLPRPRPRPRPPTLAPGPGTGARPAVRRVAELGRLASQGRQLPANSSGAAAAGRLRRGGGSGGEAAVRRRRGGDVGSCPSSGLVVGHAWPQDRLQHALDTKLRQNKIRC